MEFHKTTQPLKTTGLPPGGMAPIDNFGTTLHSTGRGGGMNDQHSYAKPIEPLTGIVDPATYVPPGKYLPNNDNGGVGVRDGDHFPPTNLWNGSFDRQKTLEMYDVMPVGISGPSTEVVRPVQQANYGLPSPRWTARFAPPIFRYMRASYGHEYGDASLNGYPMNNGSHMSMAQSYGNNKWIKARPGSVRVLPRNTITPRNVPTPLDDQVTNTAMTSVRGTAFTSYRDY